MSDEASSSAAAYPPTDDATHDRHQHAPPTAIRLAERRKKNRQLFNRKRSELLDVEIRNWDILVYAELSAIYYMEYVCTQARRSLECADEYLTSCSFLRLLLRAIPHFVLLTPKPPGFPSAPPNHPPLAAILAANLLCILLHALSAPYAAGEATRGYLHGGLVMDFIGQAGPTSKIALLLLDLGVVVLQLGQLSMHVTRQRLKDSAAAPATNVPVTTSSGRVYTAAAAVSTHQDLDSEERGVRRSEEEEEEGHAEGIEMQPLDRTGTAADTDVYSEPSSHAPYRSPGTTTDTHIFDAFNAGQIALADIDVVRTVREQIWAYQTSSPPPSEERRVGLSAAEYRGQLLRWRFGGTVGRPAERV